MPNPNNQPTNTQIHYQQAQQPLPRRAFRTQNKTTLEFAYKESAKKTPQHTKKKKTLFLKKTASNLKKKIKGPQTEKSPAINDDICLRMISTGHAWWFKRYADSQSPNDRLSYGRAEDQSRQQRIGLWAHPNPIPPWTYRQQTRKLTSHLPTPKRQNPTNKSLTQNSKRLSA